jgi:hypothetical protein
LPSGASLLAIGTKLQDFKHLSSLGNDQPNVLFVSPSCPHAATVLPEVLGHFPSIRWVHCRSAGIDFIESEELAAMNHLVVTNAKGQFSSSLAEYALMACSYFAKDLPRIMRQKEDRLWAKYDIEELYVLRIAIILFLKCNSLFPRSLHSAYRYLLDEFTFLWNSKSRQDHGGDWIR